MLILFFILLIEADSTSQYSDADYSTDVKRFIYGKVTYIFLICYFNPNKQK